MAYVRTQNVDDNPAGDTVERAILDLDEDMTNIFADLNIHEPLTTGVHGVGAGSIVGTTLAQSLSAKTLVSPVITGSVNASGATISSPTITNATVQSSTVNGLTPLVTAGGVTGFTLAGGGKTLTVPADASVSGTNTGDNVEVAAQAIGFTITKGTTPKTLTVDETVAMSAKLTGSYATVLGTVATDHNYKVQFGIISLTAVPANSDADYTISFPSSFPSACIVCLATVQPASSWVGVSTQGVALSTVGSVIVHLTNGATQQNMIVRYIAIGY